MRWWEWQTSLDIHQYKDSPTGHVNVEFFRDGVSQGYFGANQNGIGINGLRGGVFDEGDTSIERIQKNPGPHSYEDKFVSRAQYDAVYSYVQSQANSTSVGGSDYDLVCKNCVDFAGSVLERVGQPRESIVGMLDSGSFVNLYA